MCVCVGVCVAQPQLTFINGILPFFKIFADSWAQKMAARRPLDIIRNTHEHTHVCCVCAVGFDLCYPLCLRPAPAPAPAPTPPACNGLTGECLFDRRQIETCNKMIKQLLATSRCSRSLPNCGHKLFSKFQCCLFRFFFLSVYTVHCVHISGIFHIHLPAVVVR